MKKGQTDPEDIMALLLLVIFFILFVSIYSLAGCDKGRSFVDISYEKNKKIDAGRKIITLINSEVDYEGREAKISGIISEFYNAQDSSKRDKLQELIIRKTRETLGNYTCWAIIINKFPQMVIMGQRCKEEGLESSARTLSPCVDAASKIQSISGEVEIRYQEYPIDNTCQ